MNKFKEYTQTGESHDVMDALRLLTDAYVSQCGISMGNRTVVFGAAESWLERLAWLDLPLSAEARTGHLTDLMPKFSSMYQPEVHDEYDIAGIDDNDLLAYCKEIIEDKEFDEETNAVLCWGVNEAINKEDFKIREVNTVADDGTQLTGILTSQDRSDTSISMTSPYHSTGAKFELIREPEILLKDIYNETIRLRGLEKEIREFYPEYKNALSQISEEDTFRRYFLFSKMTKKWLNTFILNSHVLFNDWFNLDFYDKRE